MGADVMHRGRTDREAGFGMIEVLIAVALYAIALVSLFGLLIPSVTAGTIGESSAVAVNLARQRIEGLTALDVPMLLAQGGDRKSTRLNSTHSYISHSLFFLMSRRPPRSPLFPSTTLSRSLGGGGQPGPTAHRGADRAGCADAAGAGVRDDRYGAGAGRARARLHADRQLQQPARLRGCHRDGGVDGTGSTRSRRAAVLPCVTDPCGEVTAAAATPWSTWWSAWRSSRW